MAKLRKQTYTMEMYLNKMKDRDIRSDADVQRLSGQWDKGMINELVVTVLTDDYIPPIILGGKVNSQLWVIDGLQRSTSLMNYRYGNHKITSTIENAGIPYYAKARDEEGNIKIDENGDIVWEEVEFNIKNKTYDDLPEELKKKFNEYQVETVIHEGIDMNQISKLIRRYNNHTSMNTSQKAFTYIDKFARDIRNIVNHSFFANCGKYTEKERIKGVLERVVLESIMCMFHFEYWKKQTRQMNIYLNNNSSKEEFEKLNNNLYRLERIITEDLSDIFTSKDSFIWLTLFHKFTYLEIEDEKFAEFLKAFKNGLRNEPVEGIFFDTVDKNKGTKDKAVIIEKLYILENLMYEFLEIDKKYAKNMDIIAFVRENVNPTVKQVDIVQYSEVLDCLLSKVDSSSDLRNKHNKPSMIALVAYSFYKDIDLDQWIIQFFAKNNTYIKNQKDNYIYMVNDLKQYISIQEAG